MRAETLSLVQSKKDFFLPEAVYDMGGGNWQNYDLKSRLGGRDLIVVDYFPHESVNIVDDLQTLSKIEDNSIGNIFSSDAIEHIENPWMVIKAFHRVLKPGGIMYLTVPFVWHYHGHENENGEKVDFYRFSPLGLKALCKNYFEILECDWDSAPPIIPNEGIWRVGCHIIGRNLENPIQTTDREWEMNKSNPDTGGW